MKPFVLAAGQGAVYEYGIPHVLKLGELQGGRGAAIFELNTRRGEEPPAHTHGTEDEVFYVLEGQITFLCDEKEFDASPGSFVFLPKGLRHTYEIRNDLPVRLLVMTFETKEPSGGWGGYIADVESQGERVKPSETS